MASRLLTVAAVAAALSAFVVLVTACGGDDSAESQDSATSPPAGESTPAPSSTLPPSTAPTPTPDEPTPAPTPTPAGTPGPTATPQPVDMSSPAFTVRSKLTTVGLDEVFFGMFPEEAAEAATTAWLGIPAPPTPECYVITPANGPEGVEFTVFMSTIERVDITTDLITTRSGVGLGTPLLELQDLFGDQLEQDDKTFTFVPSDDAESHLRVVWETAGGEVTAMRAGRVGVVEPSEPCT